MFERLMQNWSLKLVALVFAVAMWIFVVGQEKGELSVKVPVEIVNIPKNSVLVGDVVSEVDVRLYGPRSLIRRMASERLAKVVDLAGSKDGEQVFQVVPEDLNLPYGVRVVRVSPVRFTVTLGTRAMREVPVRPVLKGKPPQGFEVAEVVFTPAKVAITGIKEDLKDLDWVWTMPIEIADLKKNTNLRVQLRVPPGRTLRMSVYSVQAQVKIRPRVGGNKTNHEQTGNSKKK